jgi:hypothetical protein
MLEIVFFLQLTMLLNQLKEKNSEYELDVSVEIKNQGRI